MPTVRDPIEILPLTPLTLQILVVLTPEPLHGYAVIKEVRYATDERINPGTGTFYSAIHRMTREGVIEETDAPQSGDQRRRYYAITNFGREVLNAETERLAEVIEQARSARASLAERR